MTDVTPMPNNAENYYRKAINALQNNNFSEGIHYLEMSYSIDPSPSVFSELVKLYIMLNRKNDLLSIWNNDLYTLVNISQSDLYSTLFAQSTPIMSPTSESLNELYQLRDANQTSQVQIEINQAIQAVTEFLNLQRSLSTLKDQDQLFNYIDEIMLNGQLVFLSKLKNVYKIDLDKSLPFLQAVLNRTDILNFIKNDVLHFLISQNYQFDVPFKWFVEEATLDISEALPYTNSSFYYQGKELIEDYFSQSDPHFSEQIMELFNLHSMVLYPFYSKAIADPDKWLQYTLVEFGLSDGIKDDAIFTDTEQKYFNLAKKEIDSLFL